MIRSFKSKALRRYWTRNDATGIRPDWLPRVRRQLNSLEVAARPETMDQPGWGFHRLTGDRHGRFALTVSRNWRMTFGWEGDAAVDVDLEDYHG